MNLLCAERFDTPCRIVVEHTPESLQADLELPGDISIGAGDRVKVHGEPVIVPFGTSVVIDRTATVEIAGPLRRAWTRAAAYFDLSELYEVSFSERRLS